MKRKTIAFLVVVSLLALPVMASAAAEFTFGGYLKLHVFWDSTATGSGAGGGKNLNTPLVRDNVNGSQHGRLQFTSQSSRFNFTIKGPDVWGAKTTGYVELDFDQDGDARRTASNNYTPRLRHAFFRMNWSDTELLLGQYWSMLCEFYPELIEDGPFQMTGAPTARLPQARITYKFAPGWAKQDSIRLAFLIGSAVDPGDADTALPGQESECPQIQGLVSYEADLWGKGPFYGRPRGTVFQLAAAFQRTRYVAEDPVGATQVYWGFGNGNPLFWLAAPGNRDQTYMNNWMVMGTLFLPVIPTHTKNLAGSASLTAQYWVGQGVGAFGFTGDVTKFTLNDDATVDRDLNWRWGGYVLGQYYFTNEWFMNAAWGYSQTFNVDRGMSPFFAASRTWWRSNAALAMVDDPVRYRHDLGITVYYRPVQALKFGLGYAWTYNKYFQETTITANQSDKGDNHRIQFAGWFYF